MNQYIKSFQEFKEIYTSPEFEEVLKEATVIRKRTQDIARKCMIILPIAFVIGAMLLLIFDRALIRRYNRHGSGCFHSSSNKSR